MEKNSVTVEKGTLNTQCMYKQKTSTLTQLYCRIKNNDQNCKPSLMENKLTKNKIHIDTNTSEAKYFLGHNKAVP